jgi:hypothetical protein
MHSSWGIRVISCTVRMLKSSHVNLLPGGRIFGRMFFKDLSLRSVDKVLIAGDQIRIFENNNHYQHDSFAQRTIQTFGAYTYSVMRNLTVGVIGCSGTGSPLIEQLVRLGMGKIILIDPDIIEEKNLNRILNSTKLDAENGRILKNKFTQP